VRVIVIVMVDRLSLSSTHQLNNASTAGLHSQHEGDCVVRGGVTSSYESNEGGTVGLFVLEKLL